MAKEKTNVSREELIERQRATMNSTGEDRGSACPGDVVDKAGEEKGRRKGRLAFLEAMMRGEGGGMVIVSGVGSCCRRA